MNGEPVQKIAHKAWGRRVRFARKAKGLTQVDLAGLLSVEQNTISRVETGATAPSDALKIRLCLALDRSLEELFGWPDGLLDVARYNEQAAS